MEMSPFIVDTVMSRPGEVTLIAIGPLTNIAQAIRAEPEFAANVKRLVIMGGAVALLPDGAGNITPNAEFKRHMSRCEPAYPSTCLP